jgi:DNA mismatch endonuclease, patch repair protein
MKNPKMSKIRGKNTSIEIELGRAIWRAGLRYRKHYKIKGTPDFVLVKYKVAIFCDSAFWHGYKNMKTKRHRFRSNQTFWMNKIRRNIERDKEVNKELRKLGWKVIRLWDFEIENNLDRAITKITTTLTHEK